MSYLEQNLIANLENQQSRPLANKSPAGLVCVTGANGFIGSSIVKKLQNMKFNVLALSRSKIASGFEEMDENTIQVVGSINDWVSAITELKPKIVISCDWEGVEKTFRAGTGQFKNSERIRVIANAAKIVGTKTFLCFGSQDEVSPQTSLISEDVPENPQSEYGKAKILTKERLDELFSGTESNLIWGRVFTIYGPGDTRSTLITDCIKDRLQEKKFFLRNPDNFWSFLYIDDFVEAVITIIHEIHHPETINIGSDAAIKLKNVVGIIQSLDLESGLGSYVENTVSSISHPTWIPKIEKLKSLGWESRIDIQYGLFHTLKWWQKQLNGRNWPK